MFARVDGYDPWLHFECSFRESSEVGTRAIGTRAGVKPCTDGKMAGADGGYRWHCTDGGEEGARTRNIACLNVRVWDGDHVSSYEDGMCKMACAESV